MGEQALRVLLVDDEESLREPLAKYLRGEPYKYAVDAVPNGIEALRLLEETQGHFDVALIDEVLEEGPGGLELLKQIKARYRDIAVILFTGWGLQSALEALRAGAYRYFAKPYNLEELAVTIRFAAEQKRIRQERRYMAALVKASQGLTQKISQEEQLVLVWDFVREQLEVSTFWIALYDPGSDTIHFPVYYDKGKPVHRDPRVLSQDRSTWGLAGYVVKTAQEVFWLSHEHGQEVCRTIGIKPLQVGDPCQSCFSIPFQAESQRILGALSIQSYQPHAFDAALLDAVRTLGNQVAVALENTRLFDKAEQKTRDAEFQANKLKALQNLAVAISSSLDLNDILTWTCKAAVELSGADHSGLVFFDDDLSKGKVVAEYPTVGEGEIRVTREAIIQVQDVPIEEQLVHEKKIINVRDLANETKFGPVREILLNLGIRSIMIVPVILDGKVVASFSLDSIQERLFQPYEVEICETLAKQVAVAIGNGRLFTQAEQKARDAERQANNLKTLQDLALTISSSLDAHKIYTQTCQAAVELFKVDHSGLVLFDDQFVQGRVEAEYPALGAVGTRVQLRGVPGAENFIATRKPLIVNDVATAESFGPVRDIWLGLGIPSIMIVPIISKGKLLGSLGLDAIQQPRQFTPEEVELCETFAAQVAVAIENAQYIGAVHQKLKESETLYKVGRAITSTLDPDSVLKLIAEGAVDLVGPGVSVSLNLYDPETDRFFARATAGPRAASLTVNLPRPDGVSKRTILEGKPIIIPDASNDPRVHPVARQEGVLGIVCAPIEIDGKRFGALYIDSTMDTEFTKNSIPLILSLANHAAIAIQNARLFQEAHEGHQYLQSLYEASSAIISPRDPSAVLQNIVDTARQTAGAWRAVALLMDAGEHPRVLASSGFDQHLDAATSIRGTGISRQVLHSGQARFIPDTGAEADEVHPAMLEQGVKAAVCLPLPLLGKNIGVLWIHFREKHAFSEVERRALQVYANQSAIAYDNARRMQELEHMRAAGDAIASAAEPVEVLQQIVKSAKEVLGAYCSLIWSYDHSRDRFFPEELVAEGIPRETLEEFREEEPEPGRTTRRVLEKRYITVTDIRLPEGDFIGPRTRESLKELGVLSFEGIRLDVGQDILGVLFVDYKQPRSFSAEDVRILETFANHAALALKRARLLDQATRSREAAQVVAKVSTLGRLEDTLKAIVHGARDALHCDVATLHTFDESTRRFVQAQGIGYTDPGIMRPPEEITEKSVLWKIIDLKEPYYRAADDTVDDDLLSGNFVRAEGIKSALGIQLRFGEHPVGVIFVNYRRPHRFTEEEIKDAVQFGNQAAVAIQNAKQYEDLRTMKALVGPRTATEWMRMVSMAWGHALKRETGLALRYLELIRQELETKDWLQMREDLSRLGNVVERIKSIPIIAPLAKEDAIMRVAINSLLRKHIDRVWQHEPYASAVLSWNLQPDLDEIVNVVASPQWILRAIEIFVDNSVYAMIEANSPTRQIEIATRVSGKSLEILVKDSGPGFPAHVQMDMIGIEPVHKPEESRGAGLGLVLAKTIAQTYGGDFRIVDTGSAGTTVAILLPYTKL